MKNNVIRTCHDDLGHVGVKKIVANITKVYWFPDMQEKIKNYIGNCLKCIEFSTWEIGTDSRIFLLYFMRYFIFC